MLPVQYEVGIISMMPTLAGNFGNQTNTSFILDNNLNTTMVWDKSCVQTASTVDPT